VVVGVILRKTNVGLSDRECAADSLNTIGCRYCAMAFFQSRAEEVLCEGLYIKRRQSCVVEQVREVGAPLSGAVSNEVKWTCFVLAASVAAWRLSDGETSSMPERQTEYRRGEN
jgi:hypothetical protein